MNIEESKILLKDFQKGKIEKDKLETYKGGYKLGYFYTVDIQEAIETVLSELEKKDRIIKEMAKHITISSATWKRALTTQEKIKHYENKVEREGK